MNIQENGTIVITRHPGLVQYLREEGIVHGDVQVQAHASAEDVAGKHVIGVLPIHLAALADRVTVVELGHLPAELRGQELTAEQVRQYTSGVNTYQVRQV